MGQEMRDEISACECNIIQLIRKQMIKINAVYSLDGIVLENVNNIKYIRVTISKDILM